MFHGQRIRETTGMTSKTRAREVEAKRKQALKDGAAGIRKQRAPRLLFVAADEWLEMKRRKWSPGMFTIAKTALQHLLPELGKQLLVDIEAEDISQYQKTRLSEGASNRTVNIEIGMLRQIMRRHRAWAEFKLMCRCFPSGKTWVVPSLLRKSRRCCWSVADPAQEFFSHSFPSLLTPEPAITQFAHWSGKTLTSRIAV